IMLMADRTPWPIAASADAALSNSLTKNYHFNPGAPIETSFSQGKTLLTAARRLDILIQGVDEKSYSRFAIHRSILVDMQIGKDYTLHLHKGAFKSLPLKITGPEEFEQYV